MCEKINANKMTESEKVALEICAMNAIGYLKQQEKIHGGREKLQVLIENGVDCFDLREKVGIAGVFAVFKKAFGCTPYPESLWQRRD